MKKDNNYIMSILLLLFILTVMINYLLMSSRKLDKISSLDIDGRFESKEIYDILQLNYDTYRNDAIERVEINKKNFVEIYIASKTDSVNSQVDYLYYYESDDNISISFVLCRYDKVIASYTINEVNRRTGIISFNNANIELTDTINIVIDQKGSLAYGTLKTNFYYDNGLIKY